MDVAQEKRPMKKIAKNQKAAAIVSQTNLETVSGGCLTCGLVLQLDRNWLLDPAFNPQLDLGGITRGGGFGG
jgi:hypothetical protein